MIAWARAEDGCAHPEPSTGMGTHHVRSQECESPFGWRRQWAGCFVYPILYSGSSFSLSTLLSLGEKNSRGFTRAAADLQLCHLFPPDSGYFPISVCASSRSLVQCLPHQGGDSGRAGEEHSHIPGGSLGAAVAPGAWLKTRWV